MCSGDTTETKNEHPKKGIRPVERQKMRPWLTELLDSGSVHGLSWENKEHGTFRINWKHGSRHGWSSNRDASLFQRYAEHTGRFDENKPNPKKWKANFRCALNSLPDVVEQRDKCVSKGHQAHKVYRFLDANEARPRVQKSCEKKSNNGRKRPKKDTKIEKHEIEEDNIPAKACRSGSIDSLESETIPQRQQNVNFDDASFTFIYPKHYSGCRVIQRDLTRSASVPVQSSETIPRPPRPLSENDCIEELRKHAKDGKRHPPLSSTDKCDLWTSCSSLASHSVSSGDIPNNSDVSSSSDSCESRSSSPCESNETILGNLITPIPEPISVTSTSEFLIDGPFMEVEVVTEENQ